MLAKDDYHGTIDSLADWLSHHGIRVVKNHGGGRSSCLIISLIQHASGNYGEPTAELVAEIKKVLTQQGVDADDALLPTDRPRSCSSRRSISASRATCSWCSSRRLPSKIALRPARGARPGTPVVIWDQIGHFEALTMSS
jgi:hypothetical protein